MFTSLHEQAELVRLVCHWGAARPLASIAAALAAGQQQSMPLASAGVSFPTFPHMGAFTSHLMSYSVERGVALSQYIALSHCMPTPQEM